MQEMKAYDRAMLFERAAKNNIKNYILLTNKELKAAIVEAELKNSEEE